jgi:hypothetical protein
VVKVDIIAHRYPWQEPVRIEEGVRPLYADIGAMSFINAIFKTAQDKDFVDMYFFFWNTIP